MFPTGFQPQRNGTPPLASPVTPAVQVGGIAPPVGGLNLVDPLAALPPQNCLKASNMIADGRLMSVRPGYYAFATSVGATTDGVRMLLPFVGGTPANNKLFAMTLDGIYDITAGGAIGAAAETFSSGTTTAGYGVWTDFVSDAGTHYAFYADPVNGLFRYAEAGSWDPVTDITGVSETALVFCMQHKGRLWFAEVNSGRGWYLASGAISGAATKFDFGNKFNHGGRLVGLYNWTIDGGEGVDDHLVAIGSEGDVMVYKGEDPSSAATWQLVGQYYLGAIPTGYRVGQAQGGDLYLLCQYGVIPLTRLLQGTLVQQEQSQLSRNISPLIVDKMLDLRTTIGWEMRNDPEHNVFIVSTPIEDPNFPTQFILSTRTNGWTLWNTLPYLTGDVFGGKFYFGDHDDTVWILDGTSDARTGVDDLEGTDIEWEMFTPFLDYGDLGNYHVPSVMRLMFLSASQSGLSAAIRFDYDTRSAGAPPAAGAVDAGFWDIGEWDEVVWDIFAFPYQVKFGAAGTGRTMALALRGRSNAQTGFIRGDLLYTSGGPL